MKLYKLVYVIEKCLIVFFLLWLELFLIPDAYSAKIPKRHRLGFSAGYTLTSYDESHANQPTRGVSGFSQTSITTKAVLRYFLLPPMIDMEANVYYTALPLQSNVPATKLQFLGSNVRVGLVVPYLPKYMGLTLMGGYYYVSTYVTGNAFGFQNLKGLQIYPELSWLVYLPQQMPLVFTTYYKYSPVAPTLRSLTFASREVSTGLNIRFPVGGQNELPRYAYIKAISVGFNYTHLNPKIQEVRLVTIESRTWSFYLGYDF